MQHSNTLSEISKALCEAQTAMKAAKRDATNPFFKSNYTTLESVTDTWQEFFSKRGLSFSHVPGFEGERFGVHIMLMHTSGEWLCGFYPVQSEKPGPQALGAAFTYARRYSLHGISGIPSEDNDAEEATDRKAHGDTLRTQKTSTSGAVTDKQLKRLHAISKECNWTPSDVKDYLHTIGLKQAKDLNFLQYDKLIENMQEFPKEEVDSGFDKFEKANFQNA